MPESHNWYPKVLNVSSVGTSGTYRFMETVFSPGQHFHYAEFGFYQAATAENVCKLFPNATLHLFDYPETIERAKPILAKYPNRVFYYANTQKYNDSYNWSLIKLLKEQNGVPFFDYCFLDGAHTFAIDALSFFMCDKLTRVGGYIDFDDYNWTIRGSSMDPSKVPIIAEQYTQEQIDTHQIALIVDELVRRDPRFVEVKEKKVFRKIA